MKKLIIILTLFLLVIGFHGQALGENFKIEGSTIIDPDGKVFIPVGANVQGMKWVWPGDVVPQASLIADAWKFNIVRVNCRIWDGYWNGQNVSANATYQTIESMQAIVDAFTPLKVVVMFEFHDRTGSYYENNDLEELKEYWRQICTRWGNNPYVWFNIMNEPGGSNNTVQQWVKMHQEVIRVIRDEKKSDNIIVVDAHYWGQDIGSWSPALVTENKSAILSGGKELLSFGGSNYANIMFSVHIYDQWNYGSPSQIEYKLHDFFTRVKEKGLALMIGEFGTNSNAGDLYYPEAFKAAVKVAAAHGIGTIWWHWYGGDNLKLTTSGNGNGGLINNTVNPTNLTWPGKIFWDHSHHQGNRVPFVSLFQPASSQIITEGTDLKLAAVAADYDDGVKEVRFYVNNELVQTRTSQPYEASLSNIEAGRYRLKAVVQDNKGLESETATISINVSKTDNKGILLYITGTSELTNGEEVLYDQMLKSGYKVSYKAQSEVGANDANNRVGVVIASSVTSKNVGNLLLSKAVPVLVASPVLFPLLKMTGSIDGTDYGKINDQQTVLVNEGTAHPVSEGFSGELNIYRQAAAIAYGVPGDNAQIVLQTMDASGKAALFTYKSGSQMIGETAPSSRVGWFGLSGNDVNYTDEALIMFDRALTWMIENKTSAGLLRAAEESGTSLIKLFPNPVSQHAIISFYIKHEGTVTIDLIDSKGQSLTKIFNQHLQPGEHTASFEPRQNLSPGQYFIRLQQQQITDTLPLIIQ